MAPRIIPDDDTGRAEAIRILERGGIVAFATDTVYGLAALPPSVPRLFEAKQRPGEKRIVLLIDDLDQAAELAALTPAADALRSLWPGGLTLVLPSRDGDTAAFRVPDHPTPRALAQALGPLPTTSANLSGEGETRTAAAVAASLGDAVDLILDGGETPVGVASTVVDCTVEPVGILRAGAIGWAAVAERLRAAGLAEPASDRGKIGPREGGATSA
ncbi:MAG TPA: L-threonylcarbamoyladenylate synthase [Candidatus Limnocylindrales bacterium]